ncbi:DUF2249 domain-containing protein [Halobellus captivus]|uniref:DUF2249 domain-containing protein n=1 Tax=Halobellus captivus TaxID=2592614 RepID=UPI0011A4BC8C|nr:DUF2249 domain-containing protein [Halobellus captivus]
MCPHTTDGSEQKSLDVREIDGEPFNDIIAALDGLSDDESLLLINSFEPKPLYDVLEQRGFEYETTSPDSETWHIEITAA